MGLQFTKSCLIDGFCFLPYCMQLLIAHGILFELSDCFIYAKRISSGNGIRHKGCWGSCYGRSENSEANIYA